MDVNPASVLQQLSSLQVHDHSSTESTGREILSQLLLSISKEDISPTSGLNSSSSSSAHSSTDFTNQNVASQLLSSMTNVEPASLLKSSSAGDHLSAGSSALITNVASHLVPSIENGYLNPSSLLEYFSASSESSTHVSSQRIASELLSSVAHVDLASQSPSSTSLLNSYSPQGDHSSADLSINNVVSQLLPSIANGARNSSSLLNSLSPIQDSSSAGFSTKNIASQLISSVANGSLTSTSSSTSLGNVPCADSSINNVVSQLLPSITNGDLNPTSLLSPTSDSSYTGFSTKNITSQLLSSVAQGDLASPSSSTPLLKSPPQGDYFAVNSSITNVASQLVPSIGNTDLSPNSLLKSSSSPYNYSSMGSTDPGASTSPPSDYSSTDSADLEHNTPPAPGTILPIDWPTWIRHLVLLQVVSHASMASWCSAAIIPALMDMSVQFGIEMKYMTYLVGAYTVTMGVGVLAWNPLADRLGRRPALLLSLAIAILATYGAATAKIYISMMIARICQGLGISAPCSLGATYIKEMYPPRSRGKALGFWTLGITAGPFVAPLVSGFIARHAPYTWIVWTEVLLLSSLFIWELLLLPECAHDAPCYRNVRGPRDIIFQLPKLQTLLQRKPEGVPSLVADLVHVIPPVDIDVNEVLKRESEKLMAKFDTLKHTAQVAVYPGVWVSGLAFAIPYGYISPGITNLFPKVYGEIYGLTPYLQGMMYIPMLVGSTMAESFTGRLGDWAVAPPHQSLFAKYVVLRRRSVATADGSDEDEEGEVRIPELRLLVGLLGTLFTIAGFMWFGVSVDRRLHWVNAALASGVAAFGIQMLSSICFSYVIDCFPSSTKEIATVMNMFRVSSSSFVLFDKVKLDPSMVGYYTVLFSAQAMSSAVFGVGGLCCLIVVGGLLR